MTFTKRDMNRMPEHKNQAIKAALMDGLGIRPTAFLVGVHPMTVKRVRDFLQIPRPKRESSPARKRDRRDYIKQYVKNTMTQYARHKRAELLRANVALWLAKNDKPQSLDQIFSAMLPTFPNLNRIGLTNMLNLNVCRYFKKVGKRWTYQLDKYFLPIMTEGKPERFPERRIEETARAIYCQRNKLSDVRVDYVIESMKRKNDEMIRAEHHHAVQNSLPSLRMMATAALIGKIKI